MATEKVVAQLVIESDKASFDKTGKEVKTFARDTGKELDKNALFELRLNRAKLQRDLDLARGALKKAKKEGDELSILNAQIKVDKLQVGLTEAKRQLNNYQNTGDKTLSRLQAKFNETNAVIKAQKSIVSGLNNYQNTGDKTLSRLQAKFNETNAVIKAQKSIVSGLNTILGTLGVSLGAYFSTQKVTELSNSFTNLNNRLKQVAEGDSLETLRNKIFEAANSARADVETYASAFARFDLINKQIGGSQEETLIIMDSLAKGLASTGAEASEVNSVMLQLSQAFGSGRLAGDEFRSVSENMPILLDILAKKLGVARGELKDMASEGLITSQVLKEALIDANEQLNASFEKSSVTIGQAMTKATNDFIKKFGEMDEAYGITLRITQGIGFVSSALIGLFEKSIEAVTGLNFLFAVFANILKKTQIRINGGLDVIGASISASFEFITKNAFIFGENIGRAFRMIPEAIGMAMDKGIEKIENFLNIASNGINNFAKKLGFDGNLVGNISLGRIGGDRGDLEAGFKSYEKFNTSVIKSVQDRTQREIDIQDEALRMTAQRLDKRGELFEEAALREAGAIAGTSGGTGGTSGGTGGRVKVEEDIQKELERLRKEEEEMEMRRNKWKEDRIDSLKEKQKTFVKQFEEGMKEAEKSAEGFAKKLEDVRKAIQDIDDELQKLEEGRATTLGERNVEIQERRVELQRELNALSAQGVQDQNIDLNTLKQIELAGGGDIGNTRVSDLIALKEAQAELNSLLEEERLIKANATEEELAESQRIAELSPTAKFLEDFNAKKQALEEDRLLREQELIDYETQYEEQTQIYNNFVQAKEFIEEQYQAKIESIEASITSTIFSESQKRIEALKQVERQAIATANALRSAGMGGSSVAPTTSSTTNNQTISPQITVNAQVSSNIDIDSLGNQLANSVILSSKGIQ